MAKKVKALDHIETAYQVAESDGEGGLVLRKVIVSLKAGELHDIPDDVAGRLLKHGSVSLDFDAPLHWSLIPGAQPPQPVADAPKTA